MLSFMDMARAFRPRYWVRWFPVGVLLIAAIVRFHAIGTQSLWNDEGNSLRLAERSIPALIEAAGRDIHPPGYYLALKGWIGLVGESEFGLRSLSALFSLMAVAFTYALGKRLFAPGIGLIAACLVALNSFQVYYAQEARMYSLLALCAAVSMWAFVGWSATLKPRDGLILLLANAAGLYTQYAYPAVMVTQGVMLVLLLVFTRDGARRTHLLLGFVALNLVTIALFLPILPTALRQVTQWPRTGQPIDTLTGLATIGRWLVYGSTSTTRDWWAYLWPALFTLAAFLPDWIRRRQPLSWRVLLPVTWLLVTIAPFFLLGLFRDSNLKFLLPTQIALSLLIGRGAWLLWEYGTANMMIPQEALPRLLAGMGLLSLLYIGPDALDNLYRSDAFKRDDYRAMAAYISSAPRPGDAIILDAPNQQEVFSYYYHGTAPVYSLPEGLGGDDIKTRSQIQSVVQQSKRIFVLYWGETERDPNHVIEGELNAAAYPAISRYYGNVRFVMYAVPGTPATAPTLPLGADFGGQIKLDGAALDRTEAPPGDVIGITLFWQAEQPIKKRYKVFIHLLNDQGKLVAQRDAEPGNNTRLTPTWRPGETVIDSHGLLLPISLPKGTYTLIAGLYDIDHPTERLKVEEADHVTLGTILVQ